RPWARDYRPARRTIPGSHLRPLPISISMRTRNVPLDWNCARRALTSSRTSFRFVSGNMRHTCAIEPSAGENAFALLQLHADTIETCGGEQLFQPLMGSQPAQT